MNANYSVQILSTSKELTHKQRVALKTGNDAISLDQATQEQDITISPDYYAELEVHNEKSEDKDYTSFIIVDKNGTSYVTGSQSFISSFKAIFDEMENYDGDTEDYEIIVFRKESKNYKGKTFITCRLA